MATRPDSPHPSRQRPVGSDRDLLLVDVDPYVTFLLARDFPHLRLSHPSEPGELERRLHRKPAPVCVSGHSPRLDLALSWADRVPVLVIRRAQDASREGAHRELVRPFAAGGLRKAVLQLAGAPTAVLDETGSGHPGALRRGYLRRLRAHVAGAVAQDRPPTLLRQVAHGLLEDVRADEQAAAGLLLVDEAGALYELASVGLLGRPALSFEAASPVSRILAPGQVEPVLAEDLPGPFRTRAPLHWLATSLHAAGGLSGLLLLGFADPPPAGRQAALRATALELACALDQAWVTAWGLRIWSDGRRQEVSRAIALDVTEGLTRTWLEVDEALQGSRRDVGVTRAVLGALGSYTSRLLGALAAIDDGAEHPQAGLGTALVDYARDVSLLTGCEVLVRIEGEFLLPSATAGELFASARELLRAALPRSPVTLVLARLGSDLLLGVSAPGEVTSTPARQRERDALDLARNHAATIGADLRPVEDAAGSFAQELRYGTTARLARPVLSSAPS